MESVPGSTQVWITTTRWTLGPGSSTGKTCSEQVSSQASASPCGPALEATLQSKAFLGPTHQDGTWLEVGPHHTARRVLLGYRWPGTGEREFPRSPGVKSLIFWMAGTWDLRGSGFS